ncbi:ATP-binding protein [Sulfitobacter sp. 1A12126]|uniref:ATP-binding protein n=1 Tax=Sulfitobacter sp. 1A12126 TaxID=3368591 RepID=UPI0037468D9A
MDIETSGAIKLFFPNPSLSLVYFEAVANSLDAGATEIDISIGIRSFDDASSLTIAVSDNGDGFTDDNFDRFRKLLRPRDRFHKGIGRLVFLNYFERVEVDSYGKDWRRRFTFRDGFDGRAPLEAVSPRDDCVTKLVLKGFSGQRIKSYDDLKPDALKNVLIEQFLPTLDALKRDGKEFKIKINLETDEKNHQKEFFSDEVLIEPRDLPEMTRVEIKDNAIDAISSIQMSYHIAPVSGRGRSLVAFSIDGRTIPVSPITQSSFPHGYLCVFLFESELFHSKADSSRQKIILPPEIKERHLYEILRREVGRVLSDSIPEVKANNEKVERAFEDQFPHLLGYFEKNTVGLINSDDALTLAQQKFFRVQKEILQSETLSDDAYEKSLEMSSRTLTEYVLYREKIIARMKAMKPANAEVEIHNLIAPRFRELSQSSLPTEFYQNNAWLLDDKFMVFRTILSEKTMDATIQAIRIDDDKIGDTGRPDITMIFSADPQDKVPVDVVVVEIKRKQDDEKDNFYAINQLLDRAGKLVAHCPNIQRVWYYAIMDVDERTAFRLRQMKWTPFFSKGQVFYQEFQTPHPDGHDVPTPTFVVSFDAIVADAAARNHTFLEILRTGMKKYAQAKS